MGIEAIVIIVALILSIVLHEVAHGYAANWLGDPTARLSGRLTANPLVHIDILGSIIVPGLLFLSHAGFLFGWAKPVPYNPYNLSNQRWGEAIVSAAGPATNLLLAIIFALIIRAGDIINLSDSALQLAGYIVFINILLACFNLIPVPPLDGSKILLGLLPPTKVMPYLRIIRHAPKVFLVLLLAEWGLHIPVFSAIINPLWQPYYGFWQFVIFGGKVM